MLANNEYFDHKYKMLKLVIVSPIVLGLFLKGYDLGLYSKILTPKGAPASVASSTVDAKEASDLENATYYYDEHPRDPGPASQAVAEQVSDTLEPATPEAIEHPPSQLQPTSSASIPVVTANEPEASPEMSAVTVVTAPQVAKVDTPKPEARKQVSAPKPVPVVKKEPIKHDSDREEPSMVKFSGTGSAISIPAGLPPQIAIPAPTYSNKPLVEEASSHKPNPASFEPIVKKEREDQPTSPTELKAEPYFTPTIVTANARQIWVKTALQKTSIFNKGDFVPGFGVFSGVSGTGSPIFESNK